jgi:hypothetical protein
MHPDGRGPDDAHLAGLGSGSELLLPGLLVLLALLQQRLRDLDRLSQAVVSGAAARTRHRPRTDALGTLQVGASRQTGYCRRAADTHVVADILGGILRWAREATMVGGRTVQITCTSTTSQFAEASVRAAVLQKTMYDSLSQEHNSFHFCGHSPGWVYTVNVSSSFAACHTRGRRGMSSRAPDRDHHRTPLGDLEVHSVANYLIVRMYMYACSPSYIPPVLPASRRRMSERQVTERTHSSRVSGLKGAPSV